MSALGPPAAPSRRAVRSGRIPGRRLAGPTIAVTGAASGTGLLLARHLAGREDVRRVIALDDRRGDLGAGLSQGADRRTSWRLVDVCDPALAGRLAGVDTLVHLAVDLGIEGGAVEAAARSRRNVRAAQTVLTSAAAAGVRRVVLCTSAMVYGARADNPVPLDEDAELRAVPDGSVVGDLLEIERLAVRARRSHPGLTVTVVRPATVVGEGVDSLLTRHFESPRLLVVRGSRPLWQFCHVCDLVTALALAALGQADGVLTVGCEGWLGQDEVEALSGLRHMELPANLAFGTAERLHRLGVLPAPAAELHYVLHPWVVSSARLRAAGWRPEYDNVTVLGQLLEQVSGHHALGARRVTRTDGVVGAAGATVAVLGTAALVRRARKRRGRA